jgi:DNA-binding GntR family transcriptional regulator
MVTEIDFQSMVNIFQIRFELEALAGRLAAENSTEEHLKKIKEIEIECEKLEEIMDQKQLADIDAKLRSVVYDAANNPKLTEMSDSLYVLTQRLWGLIFQKGKWKDEMKAILDEIKETYDVLLAGDPEKAGEVRRRLLSSHVERIKERL